MRKFKEYNPAAAGLYFFLCAGVVTFSRDPRLLLLSFAGGLSYALFFEAERRPGRHLFRLSLFLTITLVNPVFSHNGATVLFYVNNRPFTLEALLFGAVAGGTVAAVLCHFSSFTSIMTKDKLLYVFGLFAPKFALVTSMGFRYVPLYLTQWKRVRDAQKATGLYKDGNIVDRIRGGVRIFSVMATWALEKGIVTADSMTARGYGIRPRTRYLDRRFSLSDALLLATELLLFAGAVALLALSGQTPEFYPTVVLPSFTPAYTSGLILYGLLCFLPVLTDLKESVQWHCLRSKI